MLSRRVNTNSESFAKRPLNVVRKAAFAGAIAAGGLALGAQGALAQTTTTPGATTTAPNSVVSSEAATTTPAAGANSETSIAAAAESTMVASESVADSLPEGGIDAGFGGTSKGVSPIAVAALVGFVIVGAVAIGKYARTPVSDKNNEARR